MKKLRLNLKLIKLVFLLYFNVLFEKIGRKKLLAHAIDITFFHFSANLTKL